MPWYNFRQHNKDETILLKGLLILIISMTLLSYIVSIFAFISPTPELRWEGSVDYMPISSFLPGDTVTIGGFLEEGTEIAVDPYTFTWTEDITWFVTVAYRSTNEPIYFSSGTYNDLSGDFEYPEFPRVSFELPNDASNGEYVAKVFVWSNLLPSGNSRTYQYIEEYFWVGLT